MPIYEYRCAECGFQKEYLQKLSDPVLTECPQCHKASFGKMLTAAGFQLKGSGWYATDFRNSGTKPASTTPAAGGDSKPEGKSEAASSAHSCGAGACSTCS